MLVWRLVDLSVFFCFFCSKLSDVVVYDEGDNGDGDKEAPDKLSLLLIFCFLFKCSPESSFVVTVETVAVGDAVDGVGVAVILVLLLGIGTGETIFDDEDGEGFDKFGELFIDGRLSVFVIILKLKKKNVI